MNKLFPILVTFTFTSLLSAQLVNLQFDDSVSVGSIFSSSANAGSISGSAVSNGSSNTVTYAEGRAFAVDNSDLGIAFTNTNFQRVQLPDFPAQSGDFTYMLSIKIDGTQQQFDAIMQFDGTVLGVPGVQLVGYTIGTATDQPRGQIGNWGLVSSIALVSGQWAHLALTLDRDGGSGAGNGRAVLYLNGVPVLSNDFVSTFDIDGGSTISIGSQSDGYRPISGTLDNIMVWDSHLSATEVEAQYQATLIPEKSQTGIVLGMAALLVLLLRNRKR